MLLHLSLGLTNLACSLSKNPSVTSVFYILLSKTIIINFLLKNVRNLIQYISHQPACTCPNIFCTSHRSQSRYSFRSAIGTFRLSICISSICSSNTILFCRCRLHTLMTPAYIDSSADSSLKHTSNTVLGLEGCSFDKMERKAQLQQLDTAHQAKSSHCSKKYIDQFTYRSPYILDRLANICPKIRSTYSYK